MNTLTIDPGTKTPFISFTPDNGVLEIKGRSIPENSIEFYRPVFSWLDEYASLPHKKTNIIVALEYFNTSSSKCLLDIFRKLEPLHQLSKSEVMVTWLYEEEDEDMMEAGDDYKRIVKLPFVISKIQ